MERVLMEKIGKAISVCHEAQGESVALRYDKKGFFTVSEAKGEDKSGDIDIPTYYYSLNKGTISIKYLVLCLELNLSRSCLQFSVIK